MTVLRRAMAMAVVVLVLVVAVLVGPVSAEPKQIEVRTVPPLAGVELELDGEKTRTGADGTASFSTEDFRNAGERLVVIDDRVELPTGDGYYEYSRTFGQSLNLALAFDLYREVSFRFVTLQGRELTVDEIDTLQLKNSLGGRFEDVDRTAPVVVHANRVVSSPTGPVIRDIVWSIDSVMVGSSNVVNRSEVRFTPATENAIEVTTLFFDATFTVGDLFFGFATGDSLLVEDPNGVVTDYPLVDGALALDDLPRGDYRVTVVGPGLNLSRPVALSRNQEVDLALLSYLDLTVGAVGLVLFATGTFITGWRRRKRRQAHRRSAGDPDSSKTLDQPTGDKMPIRSLWPDLVPAVVGSDVDAEEEALEWTPDLVPDSPQGQHPLQVWREKLVALRWVMTARRHGGRIIEAVRRRAARIRSEGTIGSGALDYIDALRSAADQFGAGSLIEERPARPDDSVGVSSPLSVATLPQDGARPLVRVVALSGPRREQ